MKVILSYGPYFGQGKKYQARFIYDNTKESENVLSCINAINTNELFKPHQKKSIKNQNDSTKIISNTNIPEKVLLPFIKLLLNLKNTTIVIGNQEFTKDKQDNIEDAIDSLHINITLKKGKYLNFKNCYYVTFKYANDEQKNEVFYDFNVRLSSIMSNTNGQLENDNYLFPFIIDSKGNITFENTGIIGGTNIPEQTLLFFITRFIKEYNAVLTIGNEKIKDIDDSKKIMSALSTIHDKLEKTKSLKK